LAARRGTSEELAEIEVLVRQMEEMARLGTDFAVLDVRFHRSIARAAHNPILVQTIEGFSDLFLESRRMVALDPESNYRTAKAHLLIAQALLARNPNQARLLMQMHMSDMLNDVMVAEAKTHLAEV
jgi:GntR family transcriptional repressor for pyruvate dehydrogenase complex